ncbi:ABC transporter ATP-binding protein [Leifsonia aquatica]|uniref:ABC transporter ATP-binding protein n=1 Tax=Leifsonia aquatica TaxID=144185 RepID=UPI000469105C|nr:ABC transporter ATP-binding protein [Leifsonia aquatica]
MTTAPLKELLAPVRGATWLAMAVQAVGSAAEIVPFIAIGELARTILASGGADTARLTAIVLVLLAALVLRAACASAAIMITHYADVRLQAHLRRGIVERLGRVRLGWFTDRSSAEVAKAAQNDIHAMHYLVAHQKVETTAGIVVPVVAFGYLLWLSWPAALLALVPVVLYVLAFRAMTRDMGEKLAEQDAAIATLNGAAVEFVRGIAVVKAFGRDGRSFDAYETAARDYSRFFAAWVGPLLRLESLSKIALSAPFVLTITLGGGLALVALGAEDAVAVLVSTMIALVIPAAVMPLVQGMQGRQQAQAAAERIAALLATEPLDETPHPETPTGSRVVLDDVVFGYEAGVPALDGVSLTLEPGTVTALVGPSGSGKSTLASLLLRFDDPWTGTITVGGVDLRRMASAELYRNVGFVLQDVALLHGTVADNIALGDPDATRERIERAARAAAVHDRIVRLPRGYDSVIGEDALLSGGEAQRVSIARAILHDAPVVVLDEATAHADPESESEVQRSLTALAAGRTVLVIAHRLDSVRDADRIVVLDRGRIAESGTHDALFAADGLYRRLWEAAHADRPAEPDRPGRPVPDSLTVSAPKGPSA